MERELNSTRNFYTSIATTGKSKTKIFVLQNPALLNVENVNGDVRFVIDFHFEYIYYLYYSSLIWQGFSAGPGNVKKLTLLSNEIYIKIV